jgi:uncharacterized protein DUF742
MVMTSRPDSPRRDRVPPPVPRPDDPSTYGDLLNDLPLDRRRRGAAQPEPPSHPPLPPPAWTPSPDEQDPDDAAPAVVRPYAWTKGRTTARYRFEIETLLSTTRRYDDQDDSTPSEYHAIANLCQQPRSIAEVAALLTLPLGVAKVLAGDMAMDGLLSVHDTASVDGESPDLALMERILSGLRRL